MTEARAEGGPSGEKVKSPDAFRTISEVAEELDLPQHVLRFWETRFGQIKPMKRGGGRRYYRPDDVDLLRGIRHLLYGEGYTIRGVQRILKEHGPRSVIAVARGDAALPPEREPAAGMPEALAEDFGSGFGPDSPGHIEPVMHGLHSEPGDEAPSVAIDRDDRDADDDAGEGGVIHATRRFMGRFMTGGQPEEVYGGLSPDDAERLQATLAELLECKRLLDQAR